MKYLQSSARLLLLGTVWTALASPAPAASDPRGIRCARPTTLTLTAATGSIDIKVPTASGTLKTLYQPGDQYLLEGGKEYVLFLTESRDGFFSFDLRFAPSGDGPAWSCRVRTIPDVPFIAVDRAAWSSPTGAGTVTLDTTRTKRLITLDN